MLKQIPNCRCKIFQPNLLAKKFQRKRTIFRKSPSFSLENLRKLSPHQKSFPSEDKLEKPAYTSALAYGLDHHIPTNINKNAIFTEFEQFFQNLLRDILLIPENELSRIKTKLRNTCDKYCNVKVPYKYRDNVSKLSKRQDIVILKQDKERGVVLMDRHKYTDKRLALLLTKQFTTLTNDPTKTLESKVQRTLRKIKSKFTEQEYKKLVELDHALGNSMVLPKYIRYQ